MPVDLRKAAVGAGAVLALAAACGAPRHTTHEPDLRVTVCGQVLARGAAVPPVRTLSRPVAQTPPAPTASVLPATYRGPQPGLAATKIVRVAAGCDRGAAVLITPTGPARTRTVVRARDGSITALVLVLVGDAPVTVYAYQGGTVTGQLTV
jgi:hypothetical protein